MKFKILNIALLPNNEELEQRLIPFNVDFVNVISGASERGKSAIIYIIDYCLGSSTSRIPVGLIRNKTNWFCLHIRFDHQEALICRRSPIHSDKEFYLETGNNISIGKNYKENISGSNLKNFFRSQLGLSDIPIDSTEDEGIAGWGGAISIRDLVSLLYQPQNIIANSNALFYRTETFQYRERLRKILPYLLNIVNAEILQKREQLKVLKHEKSIVEKRIAKYSKSQEDWQSTLRGYYILCEEYNLLEPGAPSLTSDISTNRLYSLMKYTDVFLSGENKQLPQIEEGISRKISIRINSLMEQQDMISTNIHRKKSRIVSLGRLQSANSEYFKRLQDQADRIHTVDWFLSNIKSNTCFACGNESTNEYLTKVDLVEEDIKGIKYKVEDFSKVNSREVLSLEKELLGEEKALNEVRSEINNLNVQDEKLKVRNQSVKRLYSFLGELREVLLNYSRQFTSNDDSSQLLVVKEKIRDLQAILAKNDIASRRKSIIGKIAKKMTHYAMIMNAEMAEDAFELDLDELTIKFFKEKRPSYLWEIGSAHNYLAYHLATILAIHEYLSEESTSIVPQFIIFDQPSQVYFPELPEQGDDDFEEDDLKRVENIFAVFSEFNKRVEGKVQVIVLEHVGKRNFNKFENVIQLQRWRENGVDSALIPKSWI